MNPHLGKLLINIICLKIYNVKNYRESNTEETWQNFKRKYGFTQTPAILIYQDGNLKSMIEWDSEEGLSKERLVEWLTYNNIVH